jgi:hypothetical protein
MYQSRHMAIIGIAGSLTLGLLILPVQYAAACATCGGTLSSNAAMGYSSQAGVSFSLQYDYINQDQLRHNTGTASSVPAGHEFEDKTTSQYITAGVLYAPNSKWNVNLLIPYVVRDHTTYGDYDPSQPLEASGSKSRSLGDIKIVGSYQGFLPTHNLGVQLGIQLPTGRYGESVHFNSGPMAGEALDASLQPGTGSTDLIVGTYYYRAISQDFDAFGEVLFQSTVASREGFRPGNRTNVSGGLRYEAYHSWTPQLQLNVSRKSQDLGENGDVDNTAGTAIYISPGLSAVVAKKFQIYGFIQVPVYRDLAGWQLAPRWTASAGLSRKF